MQGKKGRPSRVRRIRQINEVLNSFSQEISQLECKTSWNAAAGGSGDELDAEAGEWDDDVEEAPDLALSEELLARLEADDGLLEQLEADAEVEEEDEVVMPAGVSGLVTAPSSGMMDGRLGEDRLRPGASQRENPASAIGSAGRGAHLRRNEERAGIFSSGVIQAMAHDYFVMHSNLRDYEISLQAALLEVQRLRAQVSHMEFARGRVMQLQELLANEAQAHADLQHDNANLAAKNDSLMSVICEALEAEGDVETEAFIDSLVSENNMLWKLVHMSQSASKLASSSAQALSPLPRPQRPSTGSWSRNSSGSMTSRSPPSAPGTPCFKSQQVLQDSLLEEMPEHITEPHGGDDSAQGSPHFVLESPALLQAVDDTEAIGNLVENASVDLDSLDSLDDAPTRDGGESASADVRAAVVDGSPKLIPCRGAVTERSRPLMIPVPDSLLLEGSEEDLTKFLEAAAPAAREERRAVLQRRQQLQQEAQLSPLEQERAAMAELQQERAAAAQLPPQSMQQHLDAGGAIISGSSQDVAAVTTAATTMETAGAAPATAGTSSAPASTSPADAARATKKSSAASSTKDRAPSPEAGPFDDDEMSEVSSLVESAIFLGDFEPSPRESDSPAGTSNPVAYTSEEVQSAVIADAEGATETADVKIANLNKQYESSPTDEGDVKPS